MAPAGDVGRRVLRDIGGYLRRSLLAQLVVLVGGVVVARVLGPTDYGLWQALQLIAVYGGYASLGLLVALNREIPIRRGRGDGEGVARMRDASLGATLGVAGVLAGGLLAYALWNRERLDLDLLVGVVFMAGIVGLQQLAGFFDVVFRSANDFTTVGRLRLYRTLAEMSLAVTLVWALAFVGRLVAAAATWVFLLGYSLRRNPFPLRPRWDPGEVGRLVRLGLPLMAVDMLYGLLTSLDRLMIARQLDRTALGYYSIGLLASAVVLVLPRVVWEILYPRFGERFGETGEASTLERLVVVPLGGLATAMALVLGGVLILLPPGVALVLPGYVAGVPAARILVCGAFFLSLNAGPGNFIHTVMARQTPLLLLYGGGVGLVAGSTWLALGLGYGILGVALAATLAYAAVTTALLLYVLARFSGWGRCLGRLAALYAPFALVLGFVLAFERAWGRGLAGEGAAWVAAVELVTYGLLAAAGLSLARRRWLPHGLAGVGASAFESGGIAVGALGGDRGESL